MSKTVEIIERTERGQPKYEIASPDHDEEFYVNSYELDTPDRILNEDGRTSTDISNSEYFHIEVTDSNDGHAQISVEDYPQPTSVQFGVPYRPGYTFGELVSECGVPDTKEARATLQYLPQVTLQMEYEDGSRSVVSVEVDGTEFTND